MLEVNEQTLRAGRTHTKRRMTMMDDPRAKARTFLESSSIISELEVVLNDLIYEKPDDLHGFLANRFMDQSKQPQITALNLTQLLGPGGEPAMHIDLTIALRNRVQRYKGLTVNLASGKLTTQAMKEYEAFVTSSSLATLLNRVDLIDHSTIDNLLANFRSEHASELAKLEPVEPEQSTVEIAPEAPPAKAPPAKRQAASPTPVKTGGVPPPSKKGTTKEVQPLEVIPDESEPRSFAGQLLVTGISLACRLITANMQQSSLYRFLQLPSLSNLTIPLPIIPILQSGAEYPGKQTLVKYYMLIPTPEKAANEEWFRKLHSIIQLLRESLTTVKGATAQQGYSTDEGCLVFSLDKPEQGFDILQNAVNTVCGAKEHWFDYAAQMGPYEAFDYTTGLYEVANGVTKSPDDLADHYSEWIKAYPRCVMLIDAFRYADKTALSRLCHRVTKKCYVTSTDPRRYRIQDDNTTVNCHLVSLDAAPTMTELMERISTLREANGCPLGLFERTHHEVARAYLADLAVAFGCRFVKLPGVLSVGGQTTSAVLQRLSLLREEIRANDGEPSERAEPFSFHFIRSAIDIPELETAPAPSTSTKKDKKKRS